MLDSVLFLRKVLHIVLAGSKIPKQFFVVLWVCFSSLSNGETQEMVLLFLRGGIVCKALASSQGLQMWLAIGKLSPLKILRDLISAGQEGALLLRRGLLVTQPVCLKERPCAFTA